MFPQKESKQQKMAKDKRVSPVDNREDLLAIEVRQQGVWAPRLELEGVAIPWNSSIREFQRGHSAYIAEAFEQPIPLPKDMDALKHLRQLDLFMSLKRDLVMVNFTIISLDKC